RQDKGRREAPKPITASKIEKDAWSRGAAERARCRCWPAHVQEAQNILSMCEVAHTSAVSMAAIVDSWDAILYSVAVQRPALEIPQLRSSWRRWRISPWSAFEIKNRLLPQPKTPGNLKRKMK